MMKRNRLKRLSEEIQKERERDTERERGLTPAEMLSFCISHKHSFSLFTRPTHMFLFKAWRAVYPDWRFSLPVSARWEEGRREREGGRERGREACSCSSVEEKLSIPTLASHIPYRKQLSPSLFSLPYIPPCFLPKNLTVLWRPSITKTSSSSRVPEGSLPRLAIL